MKVQIKAIFQISQNNSAKNFLLSKITTQEGIIYSKVFKNNIKSKKFKKTLIIYLFKTLKENFL